VFLVGVEFRTVDRFHVLAQRAGIRVAFGTARSFADIGFLNLKKEIPQKRSIKMTNQMDNNFICTHLIRMGSILMFGPVGCVAECFAAPWEFAHVRFLARV
jgi:hypothetical protein